VQLTDSEQPSEMYSSEAGAVKLEDKQSEGTSPKEYPSSTGD